MIKSNLNSILQCYGHNANEETASFNKRVSWNNEDTLDEKYLEFLAPHSNRYFSRLRPLFSFEIKSLTSLNAFSHILLRDGVVHLMRFFQRFPRPAGLMTKIMIEESLYALVPSAWKEYILFYGLRNISTHENVKKNLFVQMSFAKYQNDIDSITELKRDLAKVEGKVFAQIGLNVLRGEDYLDYERSYAFEQAHEVFKDCDVSFVNFKEATGLLEDIKDTCAFLIYNPFQYWFSDSFYDHHFSNLGLIPFQNKQRGSGLYIALGPHHGMEINPYHVKDEQSGKLNRKLQKDLVDRLGYPEGAYFKNEPLVDRNVEDYFKVKYTSHNFEKLAFSIAKEIRKIRLNIK